MALEALKGKMVFLGGAGYLRNFLSGWKALKEKSRGSYEVWGFFKDFGGFF
jgi:hypothetical protein